mgnify:CR=1 FL=1
MTMTRIFAVFMASAHSRVMLSNYGALSTGLPRSIRTKPSANCMDSAFNMQFKVGQRSSGASGMSALSGVVSFAAECKRRTAV